MISIAIAYCDKDEKYVPSLIEKLKERVHVPYEVVLMDNTTKGSSIGGIRPACSRKNFSRHYMADHCRGKYIWFFDADDDPLDVPADFSRLPDEDIIEFGPSGIRDLWNKWIRADLCREKFRSLGDYPITYRDDYLILIALGAQPDQRYFHVEQDIYRWNCTRSGCFVSKPEPEKIRHLLAGVPYYRRQLEEIGRPEMLPYVFAEWLKFISHLDSPDIMDFRALFSYPAMTSEDFRKASMIALKDGEIKGDPVSLLGSMSRFYAR